MTEQSILLPFGGTARLFFMAFKGDSIYWVEVEKVVPNPFQPRREFDEAKLKELAESIRMYGVLQPLTVTRDEVQREDGTFYTQYELIAGERRLRASKQAGVAQVPVIIREGEDSEQEKLELAIIENLQREDLNAVDRALAFKQLAEQFGLSHSQVAQKVGRSREYVSNSIRLLALPEHMLASLKRGEMTEGHARTLLMLTDRPEEQEVIFKEVLLKKMSVRETERIIRKIATDKVRKKTPGEFDAHLIEIEKQFTEVLGTRVQILKTDFGGKLTIDYFSEDDLTGLLARVAEEQKQAVSAQPEAIDTLEDATPLAVAESEPRSELEPSIPLTSEVPSTEEDVLASEATTEPESTPDAHEIFMHHDVSHDVLSPQEHTTPADTQESEPVAPVPETAPAPDEQSAPVVEDEAEKKPEEDLYSIRNFSI